MALIKNLRRRVLLSKQIQQWNKDRGILLICLGIALSLWIPAKMAQEYRVEKHIRLEITLPEGYTFLTLPPNDFKVVLEGKGWNLLYNSLRSKEGVLHFDVGQTGTLQLNRGQLRVAIQESLRLSKLRIAEMNYDELRLDFEPLLEKKVPVRFSGHLHFAPEFYLKSNLSVQPDSVVVKGPASLVALLQSVQTDSLVFKDLTSSVYKKMPLALGPLFTASPSNVEVQIPVEQYTEKNVYVPVTVAATSDSIQVFPTQVRISFQVGLSRFQEATSADFSVVAELPEERSNAKRASLQITRQPSFVRNLRLDTDSVDYFIVQDGIQ